MAGKRVTTATSGMPGMPEMCGIHEMPGISVMTGMPGMMECQ